MSTFYVLRYIAGTPLSKRKHAPTLGRHMTYADAEAARRAAPEPERLEVLARSTESVTA